MYFFIEYVKCNFVLLCNIVRGLKYRSMYVLLFLYDLLDDILRIFWVYNVGKLLYYDFDEKKKMILLINFYMLVKFYEFIYGILFYFVF